MRRISSRVALVVLAFGLAWGSVSASAVAAPGASLGSKTSSCPVLTGCTLTLSGNGFGSRESVLLALHSVPVVLGTASTNRAGHFSSVVTVPPAISVGAHSIVATGETSGKTAAMPISLTAVSSPVSPAATAPPTAQSPTPASSAAGASASGGAGASPGASSQGGARSPAATPEPAAGPTAPASTVPSPGAGAGGLAETGAPVSLLLEEGVAAVVSGAALVLVAARSRRRRAAVS